MSQFDGMWLGSSCDPGLVSIIIPVFNQERFLGDCLRSVEAQDYRPVEVIVVDDGSTDGTRKIIDQFQTVCRDGLMMSGFHQSRQGAQEARNNGCRAAKGEYFLFLDGDDLLSERKLNEQVEVFLNDPSADVVYSDGQFLNDGFETPAANGGALSIGESGDFLAILLAGLSVPCFSYLFRRRAVRLCGPWDVGIPINQDGEYVIRMAAKGCRFHYSPGISGFYRKHSANTISEQSISLRGRTNQRILERAERTLRERGELTQSRIEAMIDNYRRIARQAYSTDIDCFEASLNAVLRLSPRYLPKKRRARLLSSVFGFRAYEKAVAIISLLVKKTKNGRFR
jgi:glycosyltransferase involved in cell wall biosynthesis